MVSADGDPLTCTCSTTSQRSRAIGKLQLGQTYTESVTFLPDGWRQRQQSADRDALAAVREACSKMDLSFYLDRLYDTTTSAIYLIGLTEKQREVLLTTYQIGGQTDPSSLAQYRTGHDTTTRLTDIK
jgi:predicted DNA binding protein